MPIFSPAAPDAPLHAETLDALAAFEAATTDAARGAFATPLERLWRLELRSRAPLSAYAAFSEPVETLGRAVGAAEAARRRMVEAGERAA